MVKQIFFTGSSKEYFNKLTKSPQNISLVSISSDVKDYCNEYHIWFDLTFNNNKKVNKK